MVDRALHTLFLRTWWWYDADRGDWYSFIYRGFNVFEGCAWLVLAGLVLQRFFRYRKSHLEVWYSGAFFTFGLSDLYESTALTSWLLWLKLFNLVTLFRLRSIVLKRYYPSSRIF